MANESTEDRVRQIVVELMGTEPEKVTREARLIEDLELDSLDRLELAMEIEDRFGLAEIAPDDLHDLDTVGKLVDFLDERRAN